VRLWPGAIEDIRNHILTAEGFTQVTARIELVPDEDAPFIAEDEAGGQYNYGSDGFPQRNPDISAGEWFGQLSYRDEDANDNRD